MRLLNNWDLPHAIRRRTKVKYRRVTASGVTKVMHTDLPAGPALADLLRNIETTPGMELLALWTEDPINGNTRYTDIAARKQHKQQEIHF